MTDPTGIRRDVFTLSVGDVVVQWPSAITEDDYQDLEDWWPIMLRKLKRCVPEDSNV